MTPEWAAYYRLMILVGHCEEYDAALARALEEENPLSSLTLELAWCESDRKETVSALYRYLQSNPADEERVCTLIRAYARQQYISGALSREETIALLLKIADKTQSPCELPWVKLHYLSAAQGIAECCAISEEVFQQCFYDFLFRGEMPDISELHSKFYADSKKSAPPRGHGKVLLPMIGLFLIGFVFLFTPLYLADEWNIMDWRIEVPLLLLGFACLAGTFVCANRYGKLWMRPEQPNVRLRDGCREAGLELYGDYELVLFEHRGLRRAIIFRGEEGFNLTMQLFDPSNQRWIPMERRENFASLPDVMDFLAEERRFDPEEAE